MRREGDAWKQGAALDEDEMHGSARKGDAMHRPLLMK